MAAPATSSAGARLRPAAFAARLRVGLAGIAAGVLGAAPHVLHHVGPLAGAGVFAGAAGTALFGALGVLLAVPILVRIKRRRGSWRRPAALAVVMAVVFAFSTLVIGPALTADGADAPTPSPAAPANPDHSAHHEVEP